MRLKRLPDAATRAINKAVYFERHSLTTCCDATAETALSHVENHGILDLQSFVISAIIQALLDDGYTIDVCNADTPTERHPIGKSTDLSEIRRAMREYDEVFIGAARRGINHSALFVFGPTASKIVHWVSVKGDPFNAHIDAVVELAAAIEARTAAIQRRLNSHGRA